MLELKVRHAAIRPVTARLVPIRIRNCDGSQCPRLGPISRVEQSHCAAAPEEVQQAVAPGRSAARYKSLVQFIDNGIHENQPQRRSSDSPPPVHPASAPQSSIQQHRQYKKLREVAQLANEIVEV